MEDKLVQMEKGAEFNKQQLTINILVSGKSGTSKSVLINGILGKEVVTERHGVVSYARSSEIEFYSDSIDGVTVNVWVSSQLQDGGIPDEKKYLLDLKQKCSHVDLIMYCLKMTETRFIAGNRDAQAIKKLTKTLGPRCWEKAVFVLTFANVLADVNYDSHSSISDGNQKTMFQENIKTWKTVLQNTLSKEAGVPQKNLDIAVVPAGHYRQPHLPDREYWLSILWSECHDAIQSLSTRETFHQINSSRFRTVQELQTQDFSQLSISKQPLIKRGFKSTKKGNVAKSAACCATILGIIGFGVGSLGLGNFALAILFTLLGVGVGGCAGFTIHKKVLTAEKVKKTFD